MVILPLLSGVFLLLFIGGGLGGVCFSIETRKAKRDFRQRRIIRPIRTLAYFYPVISIFITSFALVFINGFILLHFLKPFECLWVSCAVLGVAFLVGIFLGICDFHRAGLILRIVDLPGGEKPFSCELTGPNLDPNEWPDAIGSAIFLELRREIKLDDIPKEIKPDKDKKDSKEDNEPRSIAAIIARYKTGIEKTLENGLRITFDPEAAVDFIGIDDNASSVVIDLVKKLGRMEVRFPNELLSEENKQLVEDVRTALTGGREAADARDRIRLKHREGEDFIFNLNLSLVLLKPGYKARIILIPEVWDRREESSVSAKAGLI
jgi:hypothetical protein